MPAEDFDLEGVVRFRAFDEDRPVHRVSARGLPNVIFVIAGGIERFGDDDVAVRDMQGRRQ